VYYFGGRLPGGVDGSEAAGMTAESMARKGMVAITISYRLGCLWISGASRTDGRNRPTMRRGNYALMDQSAALHWVKAKHRGRFGGDPNKITIAGESAGSTAVSAQMASPLSRDLIAAAIGGKAVRHY